MNRLQVVVGRKQNGVVGRVGRRNEILPCGAPGGSATGVDVVTVGSGEAVVVELDVTVTKQNVLALLAVVIAVGNSHRLAGAAGVGVHHVVITAVTGGSRVD